MGAVRFALIVDDDPVLQSLVSRQLERMSFDVARAFHYGDAVLHLEARRPHLVCVNLELPTQSGYELCEYIRGPLGLTGVKILVTSDCRLVRDLANEEEAGANAFLKKPFTMRELTTCIDALLGETPRSNPPLNPNRSIP